MRFLLLGSLLIILSQWHANLIIGHVLGFYFRQSGTVESPKHEAANVAGRPYVLIVQDTNLPAIRIVSDPDLFYNTKQVFWRDNMNAYFSQSQCISSSEGNSSPPWLEQIFVLIGAMKGGTKAVHNYLLEHPQFATRCNWQNRTEEFHFFDTISDLDLQHGINQKDLQFRYTEMLEKKCPDAVKALREDSNKMYLDDTPAYLLCSHSVPTIMNCAIPKLKILALVRNPTERALSHYNFYLDRGWCTEKSFDEWVNLNIFDLTNFGVFSAKDPYEELLAWERYINNAAIRHNRMCNALVTRGLYAIQLLHYITALEVAGRAKTDLLVLRSEDLKGDSIQQEYNKILDFLGLDAHTLQKSSPLHVTKYQGSMNNSIRSKLERVFRPYNRRLYKLLDWEPVWGWIQQERPIRLTNPGWYLLWYIV